MNAEMKRPDWAIAPEEANRICGDFIRSYLAAAGKTSLVVGLSGGIDSAVAAGLAVRALGADNVRGVKMPYTSSSAASLTDADAVAAALGVRADLVPVTPMADAFADALGAPDRIRRGNIMARCRMVVLYDISSRDGSLVLGTGNRTEGLLGYTTMHGDNACALNPIGRLYKTEIRLLARWLGLPAAVITKAPSADLWEGQSDEDELGFSYEEVDRLLHHHVDQGLGERQLESMGFGRDLIARALGRMRAMAFKRSEPPVALIPGRADPDVAAGDGRADAFTDGGFH
jgi:NAD+ synthase